MQEQINDLQRQIDRLKADLTNRDMSIELRSQIQNEVVKDANKAIYTETYSLTGDPQSISVQRRSTGSLIIKWKGKEYVIPYYQ